VWAAVEPLDRRLLRHDYSDVALLGKFVTRSRAWPLAGLAAHAGNGAVFGLAYRALHRRFGTSAVTLALAEHVALFPLGALADRFHPARGEPGLAPLITGAGFVQATWRHLVFGVAPVVLAPLAGGPSTPELAAAVADAGGVGFLGGGYLSPEALEDRLRAARALTAGVLGVNLFVLEERTVDDRALAAYAEELAGEGELGEPRFDDDALGEKLEVVAGSGVEIVSTTFGPPPPELVRKAHAAGMQVWATVATADDAASVTGADALVAQGIEAGGHRGAFDDADESDLPLLELLRTLASTGLPLVAAGGIVDRATADAAREAGAAAIQAGSAFLLCPEAGTSAPHREALRRGGETALTRAFTGRRARGIVNRFMRDHADAPSAYPHVHHLTTPLRAAARAAGDTERINLWAGTRFAQARERPAAEVVAALRD
jgi:nitronate monooxygenase